MMPPTGDLDPEDRAHFKEVYERLIDLRRLCGESTSDLAFDRFLTKLTKNRDNLVKKYSCRTVRFQVYNKDGKAGLKATRSAARADRAVASGPRSTRTLNQVGSRWTLPELSPPSWHMRAIVGIIIAGLAFYILIAPSRGREVE